jgi:hypothetical protein
MSIFVLGMLPTGSTRRSFDQQQPRLRALLLDSVTRIALRKVPGRYLLQLN